VSIKGTKKAHINNSVIQTNFEAVRKCTKEEVSMLTSDNNQRTFVIKAKAENNN
jgi:hypothetical protein